MQVNIIKLHSLKPLAIILIICKIILNIYDITIANKYYKMSGQFQFWLSTNLNKNT